MPIPSSALAGHQQVRQWGQASLERLQELPSIDFKQSEPWDTLRWRITRTCLGMGNLRGGGIIVIGVQEVGSDWNATGVSEEHLATYDPDTIKDQVDRHVSPSAHLDVVLHRYDDGNDYLILRVGEFDVSPLVCKKDGGSERRPAEIQAGCIYVRPSSGRPRTTKVMSAEEMHDLLELAAEKRARRILELDARVRAGLVAAPSDEQLFNAELGGL